MAEATLQETGFSGRILTPSSAEFAPALHRANAASERNAALIAFPNSTKDVSKAVTYATRYVFPTDTLAILMQDQV
jgi:hypothetical protein